MQSKLKTELSIFPRGLHNCITDASQLNKLNVIGVCFCYHP